MSNGGGCGLESCGGWTEDEESAELSGLRHELPLLLLLLGVSTLLLLEMLAPFLKTLGWHFFDDMCDEYDPECENRLPQCLHLNGLSPVWMRMCSCE